MTDSAPRQGGQEAQQQHQQQRSPQQQAQDESNKITPELLVDALSGHEDGLLSIAERLMTHYDSGYDAMGEAIIDAFSDVQKLFQHVVEAAHMEGAALERERGEGEWRRRMESLGMDVEGVLYGQVNDTLGEMGSPPPGGKGDYADGAIGEDGRNGTLNGSPRDRSTPTKSTEDHRHEELIDQDVRDVLIDAIKRGQPHRDADRPTSCRALYEAACGNASSLLPVDSDHRGRLQLAVARAESMSADRACAILKYAMDDVLRSGLSLRQGRYPQMDVEARGDCVLSRPNPLRTTPSRGYDVGAAWDGGGGPLSPAAGREAGGGEASIEQSAEEALNSLVEEMKEILAAPVYNLTPLQSVSEKFWRALGEAKRAGAKKEERLEQALARIKADFLLAREEYEEQLSEERRRSEALTRRLNGARVGDGSPRASSRSPEERGALHVPYAAPPPQSATSRSSGGNHVQNHYNFAGMEPTSPSNLSPSPAHSRNRGSSQSVVSMGSEFAQKAKSLVHLMNCQGKQAFGPRGGQAGTERFSDDDISYGRGMGRSPR